MNEDGRLDRKIDTYSPASERPRAVKVTVYDGQAEVRLGIQFQGDRRARATVRLNIDQGEQLLHALEAAVDRAKANYDVWQRERERSE